MNPFEMIFNPKLVKITFFKQIYSQNAFSKLGIGCSHLEYHFPVNHFLSSLPNLSRKSKDFIRFMVEIRYSSTATQTHDSQAGRDLGDHR